MIGETIQHYKVLSKLGSGGMGEVYLAEDTKLERKVALKFLPSDYTTDEKANERFKREARAAAKLNHPNIVYIHEIGEHDGDTYIAMEYVDGKSLRDKIVGAPPRGRPKTGQALQKEGGQAQGPAPTEKLLSIDEITDIATQICEGLQEAHKADITHRDIKPENILIDNSGRVKLLDFGLAQMKGVTRLTMETSTVGTAKYMSPEQYKAADIDHRTDIWSFGVVLFEMLTGQIPFEGEYDASVMYSVVNTEPERATAYRNDIPGYLDTIINKCLEKDPASRFQSMNDLIKELKAPSPVTVIEPEPETERSIVVLPFENMSSDPEQEYFSDGLTEEIITDLSHIHGLKVISRTSAMMLKDTKKDMLTIGRELNVQYVLEGSVRKAGNNLRITAQLIDATTDAHLWAEKYNGTLEDVFNIQEQVSRSIVEALKVKLTHKESKHLAERPIDNVQAYEYYLFAKQDIWRTTAESNDRAMQYIEQGYEIIGPNELLLAAQGTIYWGYVNFGLKSPDTFEMYLKKAKDCADKVFELNSESSSGHVLMGQVYQQSGEPKKSIFHFQQAVEKDPNNPDASSWLGYMYASSDRIIDAEPLLNIAAEIDPLNILFKVMKSFYGFYSGDYVSGSECFKEWYMADKSSTHGRFFYAYILGLAGKTEKACSLIDWDRPESYINSFGLFYKYALQGNASKALESLTEEAEIAAKWDDLWSLILTEGYSLINEKKKALYWLENTIKYGISNYNFLNEYDPFLENIRSEPRFKQLLECVKYGLGIPTDKATTELENDIDRSIVVLPFENMSSDPEQEYFSDGLTEEIITDLSHIHDLRVISRNSAMMLKGSRKETKTIANELNVQYVLEGSVRKAGNNLRITAQLINAPVDAHLWAEKYNGTLDDVFDIQEKVSRSIVDALKVKLSPEENVQIAEHSIYNIQAYECYLKARQEIWRFTEGGLERALQLLRNGLEIVGNNELLFSTMGIIYWQYINAGIKPDIKYLAEIENYSKNVYDMNPDFPGGHFLKGVIHHLRGDLNKAVKEYKKSLENDPNNPDTLLEIIRIYSSAGKTSVAKPLVKRLLDIDPLTPINHCMPGFISYSEGSFKNAIIEPHYMMYKMDPQNPLGRWFYAWALTWNQRLEEAYKIIDILVEDTPHLIFAQLGLFWKHTFQGRKQDALNVVKPELLKAAEYSDFLSRDIAHCYAILDEKVEALYWLENAVDRGWINYPLINEYDPFFENIRGEPRFKKLMKRVKHEWEQFDSDDPQPYIEEEETELPESQEKSIAVLPFANMSADPDQEYFCDGMAEEIINALTHIEQLKVIARTSAFMFKGKNEDMREIGKKLDVGHLLEGSVRKSGNRLRITAQLIKVSDGSHLWSEKYDRELEDVFEIQDEISLAIVDNLKVKLLGADKDVLVKHYTENMEAYDLYLKGKYTLNISTEKSMSQGIECFRKAIEIDPDFTLAYTGLSYHYYWSAMLGFISPDDAYKQSKDVGYKALQLDRDLDEAHISMANIHLFYEWDWKNAEKEYRIALEINPRNPNAHTNLSPLLTAVGREEEAIFHCRKAVELDPLSPMTNIYYGCMLCLLGNFDDSIIQLEKLLQLLPNFVFAHAELAWNYAFLGQYEEALSECEKVNELGLESFWMRSTIANVYAISGRKDKAVETIEDLQKVSKSHYMDSFNYAVIYAGLGEKDLSFENLKKAYQERSMQIYSLHIFKRTWFKSIADDPRYKELLIKMDLDL